MAKFGAGDERWIVQDLGDQGQNVNNWHWREYDALEWSQKKVNALFADLDLLGGCQGKSLKVVDATCKGEAIINNRKNKLIPAYEMEIALNWKGQSTTEDGKVAESSGKILLPYVSDENHDEVPTMQFSSPTEDAVTQGLKEAFFSQGKHVVVEKINMLVSELRAGGPMKPGSQEAAAAQAAATAGGTTSSTAAAGDKVKLSSAKAEEVQPDKAASKSKASAGKTLTWTEKYYARPSDIYECFVVEGKVRAYTQSNASVDARPGGKFSWFNGSVLGEFVELEADSKIVMKWKFNTWSEETFSTVTLSLESPEPGTTIVKLHQAGIPHEDKFGQAVLEQTETGWRAQIFNRIRQVFGYGV